MAIECDALLVSFPDDWVVALFTHPQGGKLMYPLNFLQVRWLQQFYNRSQKVMPTSQGPMPTSITPINRPFSDDASTIPLDDEFFRLGLEG